jgi:hypothetical protein
MESHGCRGRIQISQDTADLLAAAGKKHWIHPREESIEAKGKGFLQTYWLQVTSTQSVVDSAWSSSHEEEHVDQFSLDGEEHSFEEHYLMEEKPKLLSQKSLRLVDWNTSCLLQLLVQIVAQRRSTQVPNRKTPPDELDLTLEDGTMIMDHRIDFIPLPATVRIQQETLEKESICDDLDPIVKEQLSDFVCTIATLYRDNPFHCFEHASHVTVREIGRATNC